VYTTCPANLIFLCDGQTAKNLSSATQSMPSHNLLSYWSKYTSLPVTKALLSVISTCAAMYIRPPLFWDVTQSSGSRLLTFRINLPPNLQK
jgi:hypothetical protein